jgi:thiosulfate dehydrogenase (quinone) large subunit
MRYLNTQLAYFAFRISFGINFIIHAVVKLDSMRAFIERTSEGFNGTYIPWQLAAGYAALIPFIELVIGVLLTIGLYTRAVLFLGIFFMTTLVMGKGIQTDWDVVTSQLIYILVFYFLLRHNSDNILQVRKDSQL